MKAYSRRIILWHLWYLVTRVLQQPEADGMQTSIVGRKRIQEAHSADMIEPTVASLPVPDV